MSVGFRIDLLVAIADGQWPRDHHCGCCVAEKIPIAEASEKHLIAGYLTKSQSRLQVETKKGRARDWIERDRLGRDETEGLVEFARGDELCLHIEPHFAVAGRTSFFD